MFFNSLSISLLLGIQVISIILFPTYLVLLPYTFLYMQHLFLIVLN